MLHWSPGPSLLGVVAQYFSSEPVIAGLLIATAALASTLLVFVISKNNERKSSSLLCSIMISTSMWVFVITSLVLCGLFMNDYRSTSSAAISVVARLALIPAISIGPALSYFLRNRAMKKIYPIFAAKNDNGVTSSDVLYSRVASIFSGLLFSAKLSNVSFNIMAGSNSFPASSVLDWRGEQIVSVSSRTVLVLDDEELKAVLAHELGHIVHRDSMRKTLATAYRSAFIFDPVAHFVEAAIYRDGELCADEYSAQLTRKPAALASALIKIHESMQSPVLPSLQTVSLLVNRRESGILSKEPSLTQRIKRLLEMEEVENVPNDATSAAVAEDQKAAA
jgi:Zn-dependent protease with chaperone function